MKKLKNNILEFQIKNDNDFNKFYKKIYNDTIEMLEKNNKGDFYEN